MQGMLMNFTMAQQGVGGEVGEQEQEENEIEEANESMSNVESHETAEQKQERIRSFFKLPTEDFTVLETQCCLLYQEAMLLGCMYLTTRAVCYYASLNPQKYGMQCYLNVKAQKLSFYQRRWVVIEKSYLKIFEDDSMKKVLRSIPLRNIKQIEPYSSFSGTQFCHQLTVHNSKSSVDPQNPQKASEAEIVQSPTPPAEIEYLIIAADSLVQETQFFEALKQGVVACRNFHQQYSKLVLPFSRITHITREEKPWFGLDSISISIFNQKYYFTRFKQIEQVFDKLQHHFQFFPQDEATSLIVPLLIIETKDHKPQLMKLVNPQNKLIQDIAHLEIDDSKNDYRHYESAYLPIAKTLPTVQIFTVPFIQPIQLTFQAPPYYIPSTTYPAQGLYNPYLNSFQQPSSIITPVPSVGFQPVVVPSGYTIQSVAQYTYPLTPLFYPTPSITASQSYDSSISSLSKNTTSNNIPSTQSNPPGSISVPENVGLFEKESQLPKDRTEKTLHITILTIGSRGDVQPFLAFALALFKEGHSIRFCTHEPFRSFVQSFSPSNQTDTHSFEFFPLGGDPRELMELCVTNGLFTAKFIREATTKFGGFVDELLHDCWQACQGTNCIISAPSVMAPFHVAEKLQVPLFFAFTMPFTRTKTYPSPFAVTDMPLGGSYNYATHYMVEQMFWQPIRGKINAWRKNTLGLPAIKFGRGGHCRIFDSRIPYLYCFSPLIVPKPLDWGDYISVGGYWLLDQSKSNEGKWEPPQDLVEFIEGKPEQPVEPPIYIGFGSIVCENPAALTKLVVEAIVASGRRAILAKGWGLTNLDSEENEYLREYCSRGLIKLISACPHEWLFPRVSVVCHHGGAGTTAAGLLAGKPTVIVAFFGDQFFWGQRVTQLGVGTSIGFANLTSQKLTAALIAMSSPDVAKKAESLAEQLKKENGVDVAVKHFYRYLDDALPLKTQ